MMWLICFDIIWFSAKYILRGQRHIGYRSISICLLQLSWYWWCIHKLSHSCIWVQGLAQLLIPQTWLMDAPNGRCSVRARAARGKSIGCCEIASSSMTMNEAGRPEIGWAMLRGRFTSPQQKSYCGARYWGDKKRSIETIRALHYK